MKNLMQTKSKKIAVVLMVMAVVFVGVGLTKTYAASTTAESTNAFSVKFSTPLQDKKLGDVQLYSKAVVTQASKNLELSQVGAGLRDKTFLKIKVYVMQLFSTNSGVNKASGDAMIESLLQKNQPVALALTFARSVEAKQIVDAYKESLKANHIDGDTEPFKSFLSGVQKDAKSEKGVTLWFVLQAHSAQKDQPEKESITFFTEGKEAQVFEAPSSSHFLKNFLSIWLGKTTDGGLENLKEALLK